MKKIPEKPTFALRLDGRLKEALDNAAATFGVSTAELIRTILARMMGLQNEMDVVLGRRIEALGREAIEAQQKGA